MEKIKIRISVGLVVFVIILSGMLLIFSFSSGQRSYHSRLSNMDIQIPKFTFFVKELQDENIYTIEFKMLGSEEHISDELRKIENKNYENAVYTIDQWAVNDSTRIAKTVIITYIRK